MKNSWRLLLIALVLSTACGGDAEFEARLAAYDSFARQMYIGLSQGNIDAMVDLCAQPGDLDLNGDPLFSSRHESPGAARYAEILADQLGRFLAELEAEGGVADMTLVSIGTPIGLMGDESDFVGNMFLIVALGGRQQAIEIGSSRLSRDRGRVILEGKIMVLKDMSYYQEMVDLFR